MDLSGLHLLEKRITGPELNNPFRFSSLFVKKVHPVFASNIQNNTQIILISGSEISQLIHANEREKYD